MSVPMIVFLCILGVLVIGLIVLYIFGRKMQKKQEASEAQMRETAQTTSLFVIKKDRVRLKDAGFPQIVIDQTPKYLRRSKVPTVKAKVGPRIVTFMCDEKAYAVLPEKKEVKCVINGIYIMEAKWARGGLLVPEGKKTFRQKLADKYSSLKKKSEDTSASDKKSKSKNKTGKENTAPDTGKKKK
ncbi:MAG: hypothetical protein IKP88_10210 [Lachnospiraceae bacterium]|nr:hypothetical protein [Lachnospiraceae bacterium]